MKRFISMIVAACAFFAASAQFPMVTLDHNGELTFFTNISAFEDALAAAQDGDTVYLPEGNFISNKSSLTIDKRISIIGSGYKSQILCKINVNMKDNPYIEGQSFNIDGVNMIHLDFDTGYGDQGSNDAQRNNLRFVNITNSRINKLDYVGQAGKELNISRCYVDELFPYASHENNILITNSKIFKIRSNTYSTTGACMTLINCNVWGSYSFPSNVISSIIQYSLSSSGAVDESFGKTDAQMNAINSLFYDETSIPSEVRLHNCDFGVAPLNDNLDCTSEYTDPEGSVIGIMGGDTPFSENPSVPTVDTANSSVEYDSSANKLKVTIAVKAD